jgi:hypothetical protein
MKYLLIEYADPNDQLESITLRYRLRNNTIVPKWIERMRLAQAQYPIDDARRFYGFGPIELQREQSLALINTCIDFINDQKELVWRRPESVFDQDCLNYLHHIFEVYHGLLDQNPEENLELLAWLARLNVLVHNCESVARGAEPRHVVTYYGLPKTEMLDEYDYAYAEHTWAPGTVFLNYVEIGKTLEDLAIDNDNYISDSAFKPFKHYSADFVVRFSTKTTRQAEANHAKIYAYYQQHRDRFAPWQTCYTNGKLPLADLEGDFDLNDIGSRQMVKSVQLI